MKKRVWAVAVAMALLCALLPTGALAADSGFVIEDGILTEYTGSGGDVVIPDGVTSIGEMAFCFCRSLTGVTIPDSVTRIETCAFYFCENLAGVTIPDSITEIEDGAFCGCTGLTDVTIPGSVTTIGFGAFSGCDCLTSVTLENGVPSIGEYAFATCASLTSVTIPNSVTSIGEGAFANCPSLTDVYYGGTVAQWKTVEIDSPLNSAIIHFELDPAPASVEPASGNKGEVALTEALVRERIEALNSEYPEGMSWTNDNSYFSEVFYSTGHGCAGFAFLCSDTAFGDAPIVETHSSFDKIRVGDILRINNDTHSVVVLEKRADSVIVTEGNFNKSIHWGREISRAKLEEGGLTVTTRWSAAAPEETPVEAPIPATGTAYPSTQEVEVDGKAIEFQCYALKDENGYDTNYIKLRDLADILNGSAAQFEVDWDGNITITTKTAYTRNGSEQSTPFSGERPYEKTAVKTLVDGVEAEFDTFQLKDDNGGGYTYYKLRDLGKALGITVDWTAERGIYIETK